MRVDEMPEPGKPSMTGVLLGDVVIAASAVALLFVIGLRAVGPLGPTTAHVLNGVRLASVGVCLAAAAAYGVVASYLSRNGRPSGALGHVFLALGVGVVALWVSAAAYPVPETARRNPGPAPVPSVTQSSPARMICYSGGGCSIDGTPVPGSP